MNREGIVDNARRIRELEQQVSELTGARARARSKVKAAYALNIRACKRGRTARFVPLFIDSLCAKQHYCCWLLFSRMAGMMRLTTQNAITMTAMTMITTLTMSEKPSTCAVTVSQAPPAA